jgi:hypothetical protein
MSAGDSPDRSSTLRVAGIGAVSMMTGSSPATTVVWMRTSGVRPSSRAFSEVVTSSAADPSEIWLALPALITPPAWNGVLRPASFSSVPPGRMPSSALTTVPSGVVTGTICSSNAPPDCALAARSCERSAYSSSWVREKPQRVAIISAPTPWLGATPSYRARNEGPSGLPVDPSPTELPIGTRLIDSTPPATTTSAWPLTTVAAAKATACWEEPHCRSMVVPGTDSGHPAASAATRPML